ncbi:MAG: n-acetylglutamate synthase [Sphingobacteriales bacterium]|nr:MAG: n-acetylglutamate synthase [Sphingobacteriales bacterium]
MTKINLHNKMFTCLSNSTGGLVDAETVFHYRQEENLVWGTYRGGAIKLGTLLARIENNGKLTMNYQHINSDGDFMTGVCASSIETMPDGKYRLHENWQWTVNDFAEGKSVLEEI